MWLQRTHSCAGWILVVALTGYSAAAAVVDRIAVVVGKTVITESEVSQEVRLTQFLNQQPLDLGPEQRRAAADRLVDQQLIRNEMDIGQYRMPTPAEADAMLQKFRQEHYGSDAELRSALAKYGLNENQLKQQLTWQLAALRFTDQRFGAGLNPPTNTAPSHTSPSGEASRTRAPGTTATNGTANHVPATQGAGTANRVAAGDEDGAGEANVDQALAAWLKQARSSTRIQFKKEAFQ